MHPEADFTPDQIKVVKNFLSEEEQEFYINYIDTNIEKFTTSGVNGPLRAILMFGKDNNLKNKIRSSETLDPVKDIEEKLRTELFPRVEKTMKEVFNNEKDLVVCSFFIAKQYNGARVHEHIDTDNGQNDHFKYSGVVYLNTMKKGGQLKFTDIDYSYSPEAGDMVVFPSASKKSRHYVDEIYEDRYTFPIWVTEDFSWKL